MFRILLQTTIPTVEDDWHVGRFSLLHKHLASLKDKGGDALFEVTARNREKTPPATIQSLVIWTVRNLMNCGFSQWTRAMVLALMIVRASHVFANEVVASWRLVIIRIWGRLSARWAVLARLISSTAKIRNLINRDRLATIKAISTSRGPTIIPAIMVIINL
jgi:hypothetical protein